MEKERGLPYLVKVIKIPDGPAPEKFRKSWVGLQLPALGDNPVLEQNFVTGELRKSRESILVLASSALDILEKKDPDAARWFREHMPPDMELFSFGADEVQRIS